MAVLGVYVASMGLFAFGCSAGTVSKTVAQLNLNSLVRIKLIPVEFEEIKKK